LERVYNILLTVIVFFNGLIKLYNAIISTTIEKQTRSNLILGPHLPPSTACRRHRFVSPAGRNNSPQRSNNEDIAAPTPKTRAP